MILYRRSPSGFLHLSEVEEPNMDDVAEGWLNSASTERNAAYAIVYCYVCLVFYFLFRIYMLSVGQLFLCVIV